MARAKYSEKLQDPRWQRRRLEIMELNEWMCQHCYATNKTLSVHHKYYVSGREPWEYRDEALITLCNDCHREWEDNKNIIYDFTKVLLDDGWTPMQLSELLDILRQLPSGEEALYRLGKVRDEYITVLCSFAKALKLTIT